MVWTQGTLEYPFSVVFSDKVLPSGASRAWTCGPLASTPEQLGSQVCTSTLDSIYCASESALLSIRSKGTPERPPWHRGLMDCRTEPREGPQPQSTRDQQLGSPPLLGHLDSQLAGLCRVQSCRSSAELPFVLMVQHLKLLFSFVCLQFAFYSHLTERFHLA